MLKKLFGSKKFLGLLIGMAAEIVTAVGWLDIPRDMQIELMKWLGLSTGGYVLGQGIADHGKEAKKIEKGIE